MKKQNLLKLQLLLVVAIFAVPAYMVFAGSKNQNGENGIQGTDRLNGLDGCRPGIQSGNYWVYVPSDVLDGFGFTAPFFHEWEGGPCCPSNTLSDVGNLYPRSNECCNGPDYLPSPPFDPEIPTGEQAPGNHCICFEIREYPFSILPL
jgi:hypothetical protein